MFRNSLHFIFAGLAILLAVVFFIQSLNLPKTAYQLPRILIVIVFSLSIAMILSQLVINKKKKTSITDHTPTAYKHAPFESTEEIHPFLLIRVFIFILMTAVYILSIERIGYFIMTPVYIAGTLFFLKAATSIRIILIAVGFTLFVYVLFVLFLHLPIPTGLFS